MLGMKIRKDRELEGQVCVAIPKNCFKDQDMARDFMDVLKPMRSFSLTLLRYDREDYEYVGIFKRPWRPTSVQRFGIAVDKRFCQFLEDRGVFEEWKKRLNELLWGKEE